MSLHTSLAKWQTVTGELPWGIQRVLYEALELVASEDVKMVHGADYAGKYACLINTVGQMLATGGGSGIPASHYGPLVSTFDSINRQFQQVPGYNDPLSNTVSPMTAEVLLRHFGPQKPKPEAKEDLAAAMETFSHTPFVEPTDDQLAADWEAAQEVESKGDEVNDFDSLDTEDLTALYGTLDDPRGHVFPQ